MIYVKVIYQDTAVSLDVTVRWSRLPFYISVGIFCGALGEGLFEVAAQAGSGWALSADCSW